MDLLPAHTDVYALIPKAEDYIFGMEDTAAEEEGQHAPAARAAAQLHDGALFETPKGSEVRPVPARAPQDAATAAAARVTAANAAYEAEMNK